MPKRLGPKRLGPKRLGAETSRGRNGLVPKRLVTGRNDPGIGFGAKRLVCAKRLVYMYWILPIKTGN